MPALESSHALARGLDLEDQLVLVCLSGRGDKDLAEVLAQLKTLVVYLMAMPETPRLAQAAVEAGADVVELGFPFSDPLADGPVIRRAGERALAAGMRTARCLECLAETRALVDVPLIPMTYSSLLDAYGYERFERDATGGRRDVADRRRPARRRAARSCAGSSSSRRPRPTSASRLAAASTDGWLYLVTVTGTTGARSELAPTLAPLAARARSRHRRPPLCGIRHRDARPRARGRRARRRHRRRLARGRGCRVEARTSCTRSSARSAPALDATRRR